MLVVGLGNPGGKYDGTRHNIGFELVDKLAQAHQAGRWKKKYRGLLTDVRIGQHRVWLLKPATYMNASGTAVQAAMAGLKKRPEDVWICHDELDLPVGRVKFKINGGHAGHNGIRSIIDCVGGVEIRRVRIGIGHPGTGADVVRYVLGRFKATESGQVLDSLDRAARALEIAFSDSFDAAISWLHTEI